jgi:hypothetical protein
MSFVIDAIGPNGTCLLHIERLPFSLIDHDSRRSIHTQFRHALKASRGRGAPVAEQIIRRRQRIQQRTQ